MSAIGGTAEKFDWVNWLVLTRSSVVPVRYIVVAREVGRQRVTVCAARSCDATTGTAEVSGPTRLALAFTEDHVLTAP